MQLSLQIQDKTYFIPLTPIDISIPLNFNGLQPNTYGVDSAQAQAFEGGGWVGDVRRGGSCNFEVYRFIPHCNGTHTECVGHITAERMSIHTTLRSAFFPATLISVEIKKGSETQDTYSPSLSLDDYIIDSEAIKKAINSADADFLTALVIRTYPNPEEKKYRDYTKIEPAFFTLEAMQIVRDLGVQHLLIDLPSVDRLHDEGKLSAHHIFWEMPQGCHSINETPSLFTITEFIYVPNEMIDGKYLLNLQIAPFMSDASPSRPFLYPLTEK